LTLAAARVYNAEPFRAVAHRMVNVQPPPVLVVRPRRQKRRWWLIVVVIAAWAASIGIVLWLQRQGTGLIPN
jgi:hypothetical protein